MHTRGMGESFCLIGTGFTQRFFFLLLRARFAAWIAIENNYFIGAPLLTNLLE